MEDIRPLGIFVEVEVKEEEPKVIKVDEKPEKTE